MVKSLYVDRLRRDARRQLVTSLVPTILMRLRRKRMYRRAFPEAFVADDAAVSLQAKVGDGVIVRSGVVIGRSVSVGAFSTLGVSCLLRGAGAISIGPYCSIGPDVAILSENHAIDAHAIYPLELYRDDRNLVHREFTSAPVAIGGDCWIGQRAIILAGAEIGPGSVVAAGSVVTAGSYPAFAILGGAPAKLIKRRFDDVTVERLLADPWWQHPPEQVFGAEFSFLHTSPAAPDAPT